ncbi:hypothetical protein [Saccharicrinis aurantiacus]|nr:hypothetical protein [Saccharicrinis aurantiacus]
MFLYLNVDKNEAPVKYLECEGEFETGVSQITVKGEELRETKISIECK